MFVIIVRVELVALEHWLSENENTYTGISIEKAGIKKKKKKGTDAKLIKMENQAPYFHMFCVFHTIAMLKPVHNPRRITIKVATRTTL